MHILDVISSVSRFSKCTEIAGGSNWGIAPDPNGELTALPQTPWLGLSNLLLRSLLLRRREVM